MKPGIAAVLAAVLLAACSSTTTGSGVAGGSGGSASSSADFPSGAASAPPPSGSSAAASTPPTTSGPGRPVHPVPDQPLRTVDVTSPEGHHYVVKLWADVKDATCFDHAHGQPIVTFLTQHPCAGLQRFLGTTTVNGRPVAFAVSETGFQGPAQDPYRWTAQFTKLEEADGTGSIDDLLSEGYGIPGGPSRVPAGEAFNVVGQDEGVTVWDAWYLDGPTPTNAKALMTMTMDLFLHF